MFFLIRACPECEGACAAKVAAFSQKVGAFLIKLRRSVSDNGQGFSRQHSLHASTKCRPQSATPLRSACSASSTTTRYGTSLHWPH